MEFGDNVVKFNIFDAMRHPRKRSILRIDVIDDVIDELFDSVHAKSLDVSDKSNVCCYCRNNTWCHNCADFLDISMYDESVSYGESCIHDVDDGSDYSIAIPHCTDIDTKDIHELLDSTFCVDSFAGTNQAHISSIELLPPTTFFHSIEQPPKLELKILPEHLKYAFLEKEERLPIIITKHLLPDQETRLLQVLQTYCLDFSRYSWYQPFHLHA